MKIIYTKTTPQSDAKKSIYRITTEDSKIYIVKRTFVLSRMKTQTKEPPDLIRIAETLPRTEGFDHTHILSATLFKTLDEGFLFNLFNFYVFKMRNELAYENYGRIFLNKIGLNEGYTCLN